MNRFETAELTGVDFSEMRDILSRAIDNLEKAKASYVFIKFIAKNTPYRFSQGPRRLFFRGLFA